MSSRDPLVGRVIGGRYRVLDVLKSGAMATVYRAHHPTIDKTIALKIQNVKHCPPSFEQRFEREAKMASRLDHQNIVRVLDSGREGDLLFIAMELISGETLAELILAEAPMGVGRIIEIMSQIAAALSAAHEVGIIHRDIKPANILIAQKLDDEGRKIDSVKVCDFGVAKIAPHLDWAGDGKLTQTGALIGTPHYMSPEQAGGENVDERTDIYACGVMLYEMATGVLPFKASSIPALLAMQLSSTVLAPSMLVPRLDRDLERIIMRAMAKDPEQRFDDARALRRSLKNLGNEDTVQEGVATELDMKHPLRGAGLNIPDADTIRDHADADTVKRRRVRGDPTDPTEL